MIHIVSRLTFFARNCFAVKKLKDQYNVSFMRYNDKVLKLLKRRSDEVISEIAAKLQSK